MTGQMAGQLIAVAMLLLAGAGNVLLTLNGRPAADVVKSIHERRSGRRRKFILLVVVVVGVVLAAKYKHSYLGTSQGMFAAQLMAIVLAVVAAGKVRALTIWFAKDDRPRMALASVPLWLTISVVAVWVDTHFPRTLDVVMAWWQFGVFDNPHIPEGPNAGGGFVYQLYYGEERVVLGIFTPLAITMLIGAMAVWAKLYDDKRLAIVPLCGFAVGMSAVTAIAEATQQTIPAAPVMFACTAIPAAGVALMSPYRWLLFNWGQDWNHDLHRI